MKKTFLFGLLAGSLMLSATSCKNPDIKSDEDVATTPLPPIPAAPDTTGGKTPSANEATREINAVNATEDIKKMQPTM
ncbi:hypothetical protein MUN84_13435 [Hymenobacter sp. 5516J-16]|uniref:Coproporphyrinogen III oxidase n=1 Tax=Hymenobacter sublimis TaxID=2933777 RepID=A0ABY4JA67_9BACT|nr:MULTISPECIES: hypothetical protein [Hymenobacter]UOQ75670.1 hypothetical protein MUN84_13435 [Hymenobacter sp. 5516J-16]UPL49336.1 hypothetical protein MWH26_00110 [Hymenobacter sublimis]